MTKKIIFFAAGFLLSIFITGEIFSQTWITSTINSTAVSSLKFPGPNTGYAYYNKKVYKSTSKGKTWNEIHDFNTEPMDVFASMVATTDNVIMLHGGLKIFRSTDGGANWSNSSITIGGSPVTTTSETPIIKFKDQNVGFFTYTKKSYDAKTYIFRTTDGGSSWSQVASFETTSDITTVLTDFGFSITNSNEILATGFFWNRNSGQKTYLTTSSTDNGASWSSVGGGSFGPYEYQYYEAVNYFDNANNDHQTPSFPNSQRVESSTDLGTLFQNPTRLYKLFNLMNFTNLFANR